MKFRKKNCRRYFILGGELDGRTQRVVVFRRGILRDVGTYYIDGVIRRSGSYHFRDMKYYGFKEVKKSEAQKIVENIL